LMRATKLLSWKSHGEERLLRDYLLPYFVDLPFSFWEEYYWRNMTGTCRHTMHKQLKANEQDMGWMKDLFIETGFDMYTFGVGRPAIKEFVQRMSLLTPSFNLGSQVQEAVENYPKRYYEMNGRAQVLCQNHSFILFSPLSFSSLFLSCSSSLSFSTSLFRALPS